MFDMQVGSPHGKNEQQLGHVFSCRPDDPGRNGVVSIGYCPEACYVDRTLVRSKPLHTFEVGFRITGMYDYMDTPFMMDLQQLRTHLLPIVRMHFEVQGMLAGAGANIAIKSIDWKD